MTWLVLLAACQTTPYFYDSDTPDDTDVDTDTDSDTQAPGSTDEDVVRDLLAGNVAWDDARATVSWSDGFPVATDDGTWLFVADDTADWHVAGDFTDWSPVAMVAGDGFLWAEIAVDEPVGARYKLTHDDVWDADPLARAFEYDAFGEISFVAPPDDRPRIDRWPGLSGEGLSARDVNVLVPQGAGPWPVVYVADGQNLFDPDATWGGWHVQDAVTDAVLVVGVFNTPDRFDEYTHTPDVYAGQTLGGRGDDWAALVQEDLRPHIEDVYGSTGIDAVMGSSLGGLAALYTAHLYPGEFDLAASLSGTLGWGSFGASNPVMVELYEGAGHRDTVLYVDSGGSDGGDGCSDPDGDGLPEDDPNATDNFCTNRDFADRMAALGYAWDEDLFHWHEPGAQHNEAAWAARVHRPLEILAGL